MSPNVTQNVTRYAPKKHRVGGGGGRDCFQVQFLGRINPYKFFSKKDDVHRNHPSRNRHI